MVSKNCIYSNIRHSSAVVNEMEMWDMQKTSWINKPEQYFENGVQ